MTTTIRLSDMLLMQMVGGLEEFVAHVSSNSLPHHYIEKVRATATTPSLFREIVKKTITTQFGNPLTSLRELGQNARDAYNGNSVDKIIEFLVEEKYGRQFVSTRDYGVGMSPDEVFTMLLVPYNSGKEFDPEKIGEHGIGFFSNFDISDLINVTTRNGVGLTTCLRMLEHGDDWCIDYELSDTAFQGTNVTLRLDRDFPEIEIYQTLVKNLGFLNSGFTVKYNGERLNQLPDFYELVGSFEVTVEKRKEALRLGFAGKDLRNNPFFIRAPHPGNLVMTQNGLRVKEPSVSELIEDEILEDLLGRMIRLGYNFWVDLPSNVGLTKGRNNIVARDVPCVSHAATEAFSEGVLEKIVEDDFLVYELDTQLADVVAKVLGMKVNEKTITWRAIGTALANFYHYLHDTEIDISFKNFRFDLAVFSEPDSNESDALSARKRRYAKAFSYGEIEGFSGKLIKKRIIPAITFMFGMQVDTKVSVLDIIDHYCDGTLYTTKHILNQAIGGMYVDLTSSVVSSVIRHLDSQTPKDPEGRSLVVDLKDIWRGGRKGLFGFRTAIGESVYALHSYFEKLFEPTSHDFRRTKREDFELMAARHGVGQEYVTLFDSFEHIDNLISQANGINTAKIRLFGKSEGYNVETAHTNLHSMGFNVYHRTVGRYINSIRSGKYCEADAMSLIELVIHEKAHDVMGWYNPVGDHGKEFYNKVKKGLREKFYEYCKRECIDPYHGLNANLKPVKTAKLNPQRLKSLL